MHLSAASVDLDGNIIASGSIVHSQDDRGEFDPCDGDRLKISRGEWMKIVRCSCVREDCGFLRSEEYGAGVLVPAALATVITRALRLGAAEPQSVTLNHQEGELSNSFDPTYHLCQPLSDWHLAIDEREGEIFVVLSAALHARHLREWLESEANFWAQQPGQRVEVRFSINAATRVACFGAYVAGAAKDDEGELATPSLFDGSRLASSMRLSVTWLSSGCETGAGLTLA